MVVATFNIAPAAADDTLKFFDEAEKRAEANANYFENLKSTLTGEDDEIKEEFWTLFIGSTKAGIPADDAKKQIGKLATQAFAAQELLNRQVAEGKWSLLRKRSHRDRAQMGKPGPVEDGLLRIQECELFWRVARNFIHELRLTFVEMEKELANPDASGRWLHLLWRLYSEFFTQATTQTENLVRHLETVALTKKLSNEESLRVGKIREWIEIQLFPARSSSDPDLFLEHISNENFTSQLEGLAHYPIISQTSNDLFDIADIMESIKGLLNGSLSSAEETPAGWQAQGTLSGEEDLYKCFTSKSIGYQIWETTELRWTHHLLGMGSGTAGKQGPRRVEDLILNETSFSAAVQKVTKTLFDQLKLSESKTAEGAQAASDDPFETENLPAKGKNSKSNQRKKEKAKLKKQGKTATPPAAEDNLEVSTLAAPPSTAVITTATPISIPTPGPVSTMESAPTSIPESVSIPIPPRRFQAKVSLEMKHPQIDENRTKAKSDHKGPPYSLDDSAANVYRTATKLASRPVSGRDLEKFIDQIGGAIDPPKRWKGSKRGIYLPNFSPKKTQEYLYVKLDFPHTGKDFFNTWTLRGIFGRDLERAGIASQTFYRLPR